MTRSTFGAAFLAILLVLVHAAGCSPGKIAAPAVQPIKGRVVKDGKPLTVAEGERLMVTFFPEDKALPPGLNFTATVQSDGTFEVSGAQGGGIPEGKYRIAIALIGVDPKVKGKPSDKLLDVFSPATTPFVQDVSWSEEIVLDVGKTRN